MSINPSAQYSIEVIISPVLDDSVEGRVREAITAVNGELCSMGSNESNTTAIVECSDVDHQAKVLEAIRSVEGVKVADHWDRTFKLHEGGKISTKTEMDEINAETLAMAYTPGVARVCMAIHDDAGVAQTHTIRKNTVAIVSDGTAVLGLGDIGAKAAMPVMEGKALLFKEFGDVDAFPICLDVSSPQELIETVERIAPTFGGINLEDISAPGAFEVEAALKKSLDIPVFHDDQHGTAVVALAALRNALKVTGRKIEEISVVMSGLGAAGIAVAKIMIHAGLVDFVGVDSKGAVHGGRTDLSDEKQWLVDNSNPSDKSGSLSDVIKGADVFIGLSGPGVLSVDDVKSMADNPIVFAMANPTPEIQPEEVEDIVAIMATGRSDYPNQINNVLAFPGIFRGALDAHASDITENMKLAAARAIADSVESSELSSTFIMPSAFDPAIAVRVAEAVKQAAIDDGVARV